MANPTPRVIVSDKCIGYSEALLQYRRAVVTDSDAAEEGRELFTWFDGTGALTEDRAPIAARCVDLGITLLKNSSDTIDRITENIKEAYQHYAG